ncbi:MAG: hypothetical protein Phyf2KO_26070 [Phycisphaerales bacterium]
MLGPPSLTSWSMIAYEKTLTQPQPLRSSIAQSWALALEASMMRAAVDDLRGMVRFLLGVFCDRYAEQFPLLAPA